MIFDTLQNLCKSNEHQIYYHRVKEIGSLRLFNNDRDLSKLQIMYLYYLELFSVLFQDLGMNEKYISEEVINDPIRREAYLLYRKEKRNQKTDTDTGKHIDSNHGDGSVIFRKK
jgi:hypothetical protein